jgi:UDP-glucose:(heptosyl)LPS alpha-1,3-glucosyltransferase
VRIALVIERFVPHGGGVEAVGWNVARALAARGAEVHVVARETAQDPPAAVHPVRVPTFWQPLRVLAFSRAAARATATLAPDVVQSFSRTRHQDVFRAGGGSHADYLERAHGPVGRRLRRLSPRHAVLLALERAVFADDRQTILCNSAMVRDELARRHGVPDARLVVIPNGVDLERFSPARRTIAGARLRAELAPGDEPVWLLAGSGFRRKGLDTALEALALASEGRLWVAGRDDPEPWRRRAETLGVGARVRFLGARDDLEDVYAAADALLLPTRYDAFANVCLEALASGLPVVTSGANGAADTVGEAGLVVADPQDAAGFAKALDALRDPAARAVAAAAARPIAERHSWDAHAAALLALYARLRS